VRGLLKDKCKMNTTETRFELAREIPNNLAGCRLNHSATPSVIPSSEIAFNENMDSFSDRGLLCVRVR
jgi:hypothetical protein